MGRYKITFKPDGAVPNDVGIGVHLTPEVTPGSGCTPECEGWAVTVNGDTSSGDIHPFPDDVVTAVVKLIGTLCAGQCITWELRGLGTTPGDQTADFTVTPNGCDGATVNGAHTVSYAGALLGLYPSIDGKPFCIPILLGEQCDENVLPVTTVFGTVFQLDGKYWCNDAHDTRCDLSLEFLGSTFCCGDPVVTWAIVQTGGATTSNGESIDFDSQWLWFLHFNSLSDLTDCVYVATPTVCSVERPDLAITFTCDNI